MHGLAWVARVHHKLPQSCEGRHLEQPPIWIMIQCTSTFNPRFIKPRKKFTAIRQQMTEKIVVKYNKLQLNITSPFITVVGSILHCDGVPDVIESVEGLCCHADPRGFLSLLLFADMKLSRCLKLFTSSSYFSLPLVFVVLCLRFHELGLGWVYLQTNCLCSVVNVSVMVFQL